MRHVFRCVMVLTISLSLVASAAAWRPCSGLQLAGAAAAGAGHGYHTTMHRADAAGHGVHDHHGMQRTADDTAAADDSGSMKCCSMCTVATALLPAVNVDATFIVSAHLFSRDQDARSGKNVAVDPGIPKTIV